MDEKLIMEAIRGAIVDSIKNQLGGYNSPLSPIIKNCVEKNQLAINSIINDAVSSCVSDDAFREEVKQATRTQLARNLIGRIGGELEKQVNQLKSDPTTRARITMAIDQIVKDANR